MPSERDVNKVILDNGSGIRLVLTEICDKCDIERPTDLCGFCKGTYCIECASSHICENDED